MGQFKIEVLLPNCLNHVVGRGTTATATVRDGGVADVAGWW